MTQAANSALQSARLRFVEGLPARADELSSTAERLARDPGDPEAAAMLRRRLHALLASAQVFEERALSLAVQDLIARLEIAQRAERPFTREEIDAVGVVVASLPTYVRPSLQPPAAYSDVRELGGSESERPTAKPAATSGETWRPLARAHVESGQAPLEAAEVAIAAEELVDDYVPPALADSSPPPADDLDEIVESLGSPVEPERPLPPRARRIIALSPLQPAPASEWDRVVGGELAEHVSDEERLELRVIEPEADEGSRSAEDPEDEGSRSAEEPEEELRAGEEADDDDEEEPLELAAKAAELLRRDRRATRRIDQGARAGVTETRADGDRAAAEQPMRLPSDDRPTVAEWPRVDAGPPSEPAAEARQGRGEHSASAADTGARSPDAEGRAGTSQRASAANSQGFHAEREAGVTQSPAEIRARVGERPFGAAALSGSRMRLPSDDRPTVEVLHPVVADDVEPPSMRPLPLQRDSYPGTTAHAAAALFSAQAAEVQAGIANETVFGLSPAPARVETSTLESWSQAVAEAGEQLAAWRASLRPASAEPETAIQGDTQPRESGGVPRADTSPRTVAQMRAENLPARLDRPDDTSLFESGVAEVVPNWLEGRSERGLGDRIASELAAAGAAVEGLPSEAAEAEDRALVRDVDGAGSAPRESAGDSSPRVEALGEEDYVELRELDDDEDAEERAATTVPAVADASSTTASTAEAAADRRGFDDDEPTLVADLPRLHGLGAPSQSRQTREGDLTVSASAARGFDRSQVVDARTRDAAAVDSGFSTEYEWRTDGSHTARQLLRSRPADIDVIADAGRAGFDMGAASLETLDVQEQAAANLARGDRSTLADKLREKQRDGSEARGGDADGGDVTSVQGEARVVAANADGPAQSSDKPTWLQHNQVVASGPTSVAPLTPELERTFERNWEYAGFEESLSDPGVAAPAWGRGDPDEAHRRGSASDPGAWPGEPADADRDSSATVEIISDIHEVVPAGSAVEDADADSSATAMSKWAAPAGAGAGAAQPSAATREAPQRLGSDEPGGAEDARATADAVERAEQRDAAGVYASGDPPAVGGLRSDDAEPGGSVARDGVTGGAVARAEAAAMGGSGARDDVSGEDVATRGGESAAGAARDALANPPATNEATGAVASLPAGRVATEGDVSSRAGSAATTSSETSTPSGRPHMPGMAEVIGTLIDAIIAPFAAADARRAGAPASTRASDTTGSHATRADATGSHSTRADVTGSHSTRPNATGSHSTRVDATGSHSIRADVNDSQSTRPDATGSHSTRADATGSHSTDSADATGSHSTPFSDAATAPPAARGGREDDFPISFSTHSQPITTPPGADAHASASAFGSTAHSDTAPAAAPTHPDAPSSDSSRTAASAFASSGDDLDDSFRGPGPITRLSAKGAPLTAAEIDALRTAADQPISYPPPAAYGGDDLRDDDFSDETSPGLGPLHAEQTTAGAGALPRPALLLLVADPSCADRVKAQLTSDAYAVLHASTADEAVQRLHETKPDLVFVSADLASNPEVDLVRRLKTDPLTRVGEVHVLFPEGATFDQSFLEQLSADGAIREPLTDAGVDPLLRKAIATTPNTGEAHREGSIDDIANQIAEEIRRGIAESLRTSKSDSVRPGDGSQLMAAAWSAIGRVRSHLAEQAPSERPGAQPSVFPSDASDTLRPNVHPSQLLAGHRILVADDDPAVLWFFVGLLREASAHVFQAHNGREALELARRKQPHVIVSDILMPKLDGFGLCRELKRDALLCHVPVILLSWKDDLLQRMRELDAGAAGYLRKEAGSQQILLQLTDVLQPRTRLVARLRSHAEVTGSLADLGAYALLELVAAERPDAHITVRDSLNVFEVDIRGGRRLSVTRTAADGAFTRGEKALMQLLGLASGELHVSSSNSALKGALSDPLDRALASAGRRLSAIVDAVSDARLLRVCLIAFDDDVLQTLLSSPSTRLAEVVALFRTGNATAEGVLREGRFAPGELEDYLRELARCVAITGVWDARGEDLVAAAQRERETPQLALLSTTLPPRSGSGTWSAAPEAAEGAPSRKRSISPVIDEPSSATAHTSSPEMTPPLPRRSSVPPPIVASSSVAFTKIDSEAEPFTKIDSEAERAQESSAPPRIRTESDTVPEALPPSAAVASNHTQPGIGPAKVHAELPDWLKPHTTGELSYTPRIARATPLITPPANELAASEPTLSNAPTEPPDDIETDAVSKAELESFDLPIPSAFMRAIPDRTERFRLAGTLIVLAGVGYFGWQQFKLTPEQAAAPDGQTQTRVEAAKQPPKLTAPEPTPEPPASPQQPRAQLPTPQPAEQPTIQNTQFGKVLPFVDTSRGVAVAPDQGLLVIELQPGNDPAPNVRVGSRELGKPPLAVALPAGRHELVVRTGKSTSFRYLIVRAGETRIVSVPLAEL